jgi:hypothetical protein
MGRRLVLRREVPARVEVVGVVVRIAGALLPVAEVVGDAGSRKELVGWPSCERSAEAD